MSAIDTAIDFVASPHFSSRGKNEIEGAVIHYTAGGRASGTVSWFANPVSKVSAHFVISRTGRVIQMVDCRRAAWHAGASEMMVRDGEMRSNANLFTLGVELANRGCLMKVGDKFYYELGGEMRPYKGTDPEPATLLYDNGAEVPGWWEPFATGQLDALQWLLTKIKNGFGTEAAHNIQGHEEIAVPFGARKRDPGPLFPWSRFSRKFERRTGRKP